MAVTIERIDKILLYLVRGESKAIFKLVSLESEIEYRVYKESGWLLISEVAMAKWNKDCAIPHGQKYQY